jgi:hypothetical protein
MVPVAGPNKVFSNFCNVGFNKIGQATWLNPFYQLASSTAKVFYKEILRLAVGLFALEYPGFVPNPRLHRSTHAMPVMTQSSGKDGRPCLCLFFRSFLVRV